MKRGKRICNELRAVRRSIADENGIPLVQPECTHKGDCQGTCQRCEAEVRQLEQALTRRLAMGRAATVAGLSLSLAACGGSSQPSLTVDTPITPADGDTDTEMTWIDSMSMYEVVDDEPPDIIVTLGIITPNDEEDTEFVTNPPDALKQPAGPIAVKEEKEEEEEILLGMIQEKMASFPGGEDALYKFLEDNIQMPKDFCGNGTVVVRFVVEKDGSITNPTVLRDIGGGCGEEALRVVRLMPKWEPGSVDDKPVRQEFTLPVKFSLK